LYVIEAADDPVLERPTETVQAIRAALDEERHASP
jgi:hypothetical protein